MKRVDHFFPLLTNHMIIANIKQTIADAIHVIGFLSILISVFIPTILSFRFHNRVGNRRESQISRLSKQVSHLSRLSGFILSPHIS